jgi:ATP synthase complex subunit h
VPTQEEAEAQTKTWNVPRAPKTPDLTEASSDELQQYAGELVSVTPRAGDERFESTFDDVFESWFDEPESELRKRQEDPEYEKRQRRVFPPPPPRPAAYASRAQRGRTGSD